MSLRDVVQVNRLVIIIIVPKARLRSGILDPRSGISIPRESHPASSGIPVHVVRDPAAVSWDPSNKQGPRRTVVQVGTRKISDIPRIGFFT